MTKDEFDRLSKIDINEMMNKLCREDSEMDDWILLFHNIIDDYEDSVIEGRFDLYSAICAVMYLGYNIGRGAIKDEDGVSY